MKNFKFFSRILFSFVLVFVFSFNCFATSISDFAPIDSLIDNDFSNNSEVVLNASPSLLSLSSPNVPSFDPSKIPFYEAPKYITDIVYMTLESSSSATDYANYKVPFVCVFTGGARVRVIVGINIALASYFSSSSVFNGLYIISSPNFGSYSYSVCYDAWFDVNTYEMTTPWTQLPAVAVGSSGRIVRYTNSLGNDNSFADYYLYGGNGLKLGDASSVTVTVESDSSYPRFQWSQNQKLGFNSGVFVSPLSVMTTSYFSTFTPITVEQVEAETQKGIWESIKSLPDIISDKLKGLFVPEEGFFNEYFNNLQTFFSNKLGFLVYPFDFIVTFLQKYLDIGEGDGTLHLPDFEIMDVKIFNQTDFNLKNAMSSFLGEYYGIYFAFVDFIILVGLVNLALKKYNSMTGGNDS